MYSRPFYLTLAASGLLSALLWLNEAIYPIYANQLAEIELSAKSDALRLAIIDGLSANAERDIEFTATPCISTLDMTDAQSALSGDVLIDDGTYRCTVTAQSGNVYAAEIELLVINGEIFAMPALLTPIDFDLSLFTLGENS